MEIFPPELSYEDDKAVVSARFTCRGTENKLWFRFDKELSDSAVLEKSDAFFVALLPLAMQAHEDIHLHHLVSEDIYYNVTEYLIPLIATGMPEMGRIRVFHSGFMDLPPNVKEGVVGMGFSCGIDSFFTLVENMRPDLPRSYRITHCVFMDVGSHGILEDGDERLIFERRLEISRRCASELGLNFVVIESNISQIFRADYRKTHTLRNAAAILVLEKLFSVYYYSAGVSYEELRIKDMRVGGYEPIIFSYLTTKHLRFISSGIQFRRTEKTSKVSEFEPSYRYLNVCTMTGDNCSVCEKCLRTQLTLDLLGKLDLYAAVFDLDKYRQMKGRYMNHVRAAKSREIYSKDLNNLMEQRGQGLGLISGFRYLGYKIRYEGHLLAAAFKESILERRSDFLSRIKVSKLYSSSNMVKRVVGLIEHPFP